MNDDPRKHPRHHQTAAISYGFLNQPARYLGFVKNVSKSGIYFEAERPITVGALVSIQPMACTPSARNRLPPESRDQAAAFCSAGETGDQNGSRINALAIGKIIHCRQIENRSPALYGIGARYESPSV